MRRALLCLVGLLALVPAAAAFHGGFAGSTGVPGYEVSVTPDLFGPADLTQMTVEVEASAPLAGGPALDNPLTALWVFAPEGPGGATFEFAAVSDSPGWTIVHGNASVLVFHSTQTVPGVLAQVDVSLLSPVGVPDVAEVTWTVDPCTWQPVVVGPLISENVYLCDSGIRATLPGQGHVAHGGQMPNAATDWRNISRVAVVDKHQGTGADEVKDRDLVLGDTLKLHAAGLDKADGFVEHVAADWSVSDTSVASISNTNGAVETTLSADALGTVQVTASNATFGQDQTGTLTVKLGAPDKIKAITDPDIDDVIATERTKHTVQVTNRNGKPLAGEDVNWAITQGDGTLDKSTTKTDADGKASVTLTTGSTPGTIEVDASHVDITKTVTFTVTTRAPEPDSMSAANGPTFTGIAAGSDQVLEVKVLDELGDPADGVDVSWTVTEGQGALSASTTTTGASGIASVTLTTDTEVHDDTTVENVVDASRAGLDGSPVTFDVDTVAGELDEVIVSCKNNPVQVDKNVECTASGEDTHGNPVTIDPSFTAVDSAGDTVASQASGQGTTFTFTAPKKTAKGPVTVEASYSSVTGTTDVDLAAGPATSLILTCPSQAKAGSTVSSCKATGEDKFGNDADVQPSFSATDAAGTELDGDGDGVFDAPTDVQDGPVTVQAKDGKLSASATVQVVAGAPDTLAFVDVPSSVIKGATFTVTVEGRDAHDNPTAPGRNVALAVDSGPSGGSLAGNASKTADGVQTTFANLTLDTLGTYKLNATADGLGKAVSGDLDVVVGSPDHLAFSSVPSQAGVLSTFEVTVEVLDELDNRVPDATDTVDLALISGPDQATLGGTTSVQASSGQAVFPDLTLDRAGTLVLQATSSGLGSVDSSQIQITGLPAPTGLSSLTHATGTWVDAADVEVSWNTVPGADGYDVAASVDALDGVADVQDTTATVTVGQDGLHQVAVAAIDAGGTPGQAATYGPVQVDTAPPAAPTGVFARPLGDGGLEVSWDAASDARSGIAGYVVYRSPPGTDGFNLATGDTQDATTFTEAADGLIGGETYRYRIAAVDNVGLEGPRSAVVEVIPTDDPGLVSADRDTAEQISSTVGTAGPAAYLATPDGDGPELSRFVDPQGRVALHRVASVGGQDWLILAKSGERPRAIWIPGTDQVLPVEPVDGQVTNVRSDGDRDVATVEVDKPSDGWIEIEVPTASQGILEEVTRADGTQIPDGQWEVRQGTVFILDDPVETYELHYTTQAAGGDAPWDLLARFPFVFLAVAVVAAVGIYLVAGALRDDQRDRRR